MDKKYFKTIYVLFKKELMSYFNLIGQASMRAYFDLLPWIFLFMSPAISMRIWAEEKKSGTIEFLLTLPITDWQAVLAKFLSALAFLTFSLLLSLSIPFSAAWLGNLDLGPVVGGYLGALFLGGSYLALGLFISSLTKNQIIAFILGLVACFFAFIIGAAFVLANSSASFVPIMKFLGLGSHFNNIAKGVLDSKDIIYYLSFIFLFLWLNVRVIEKRAWK